MKYAVAFVVLLAAVSAVEFEHPHRNMGFFAPTTASRSNKVADPPLPSFPTKYAIELEVYMAQDDIHTTIMMGGDHEAGNIVLSYEGVSMLTRHTDEIAYLVTDYCMRFMADPEIPEPWSMPEEAVFMGNSHCALPTSGKRSMCSVWNLNDGEVDAYVFFHLHMPVSFEIYDAKSADFLGYQRVTHFTMDPEESMFEVPDLCIQPPSEDQMPKTFSAEIDVYQTEGDSKDLVHTYSTVNSVSEHRNQAVNDALYKELDSDEWSAYWHMTDPDQETVYDWFEGHDCAVAEYFEPIPSLFKFHSHAAFERFEECPEGSITAYCELWKAEEESMIEYTLWDGLFQVPVYKSRVHDDGTPRIRWEFNSVSVDEPHSDVFDVIDECLE